MAVPTPAEAASGALLDRRYRLDELLSEADGMRLWRGADTLVGELPVAIRSWWGLSAEELAALQQRLERLKAVLHPQIPRLGEQLPAEGGCWQVREWINGRTYRSTMHLIQRDEDWLAVNELDLEDYIASVVGAEMSSQWHGEALKAQAVAARSYAMPHLARPAAADTTLATSPDGSSSQVMAPSVPLRWRPPGPPVASSSPTREASWKACTRPTARFPSKPMATSGPA